MSRDKSAKNLRIKLWWLNFWAVIIMMAAMAMLIITPLCGLSDLYESIWSSTFILAFTSVRKEASLLLNTFIDKYRKDHGLGQPNPPDNEGDK